MPTSHQLICSDALSHLKSMQDEIVDLVLTSPPYPMIEMWDTIFSNANPEISKRINSEPLKAFELMHEQLDSTWAEAFRVLKPGGHLIINIGDATRTIEKNFQLFSNHSKILQNCINIGFQNLPNIIWRKQTNAPNKFMGSGMLPPGAYVTLEHEYILILRKGEKRDFKSIEMKKMRSESAYFWEERNIWFSDVWDFKGIRQVLNKEKTRERSGAFPFELAYRIINMFSVKNDLIVDPFGGTGTTTIAAIAAERNSIQIEIDRNLNSHAFDLAKASKPVINDYINSRLLKHLQFVSQRKADKKEIKYHNGNLDVPVMTRQELDISLSFVDQIKVQGKSKILNITYSEIPSIQNQNVLAF